MEEALVQRVCFERQCSVEGALRPSPGGHGDDSRLMLCSCLPGADLFTFRLPFLRLQLLSPLGGGFLHDMAIEVWCAVSPPDGASSPELHLGGIDASGGGYERHLGGVFRTDANGIRKGASR